jgi:GNAT superfamily N-acetyltransferase
VLTGLELRRAQATDIAAIVSLRDDAARWLLHRGIQQWHPGEVTPADVEGWLATGRVYVVERSRRLVGSVRLAWEDPAVWGEQPPEAGYLQALVTDRASAGHGLGRLLLDHAEAVIARSGRPLARLSHLFGSAGLARFYAGSGYLDVGSREFPDHPGWEPVSLLEKRLS